MNDVKFCRSTVIFPYPWIFELKMTFGRSKCCSDSFVTGIVVPIHEKNILPSWFRFPRLWGE